MIGELFASVPGQRPVKFAGQSLRLLDERRDDAFGIGTILPRAPDKAISPARNGRFRRASSPVSQAMAFSGLPRHAAPQGSFKPS